MPFNRFILAVEGWRILNKAPEPREGARRLLSWISRVSNAGFLGIRFRDPNTGYAWEESVCSSKPASHPFERDFPEGDSVWLVDAEFPLNEWAPLLDLLASQWHRLALRENEESVRRTRRTLIHDDAVRPGSSADWISMSQTARNLTSRIPELAFDASPLLVIGESGSGREFFARTLHDEGSVPDEPFVLWSPGGKFQSGTLYVPEGTGIKETEYQDLLSLETRLIAASSPFSALDGESWLSITGGRGRVVRIPPLRERREDIPLLASLFLNDLARMGGGPLKALSGTVMEALTAYSWPGNARELREMLKIMAENSGGERMGVEALPPAIRGVLPTPSPSSFPAKLAALEYEVLKEELSRQRGNITQTARILGLTPRQVSWRVKKYSLDVRRPQVLRHV